MHDSVHLYEVYYRAPHSDGRYRQRIGLVQRYGPESERLRAEGKLIVEDSVLPLSYVVDIDDVVSIEDSVPAGIGPRSSMPIDVVISSAWHRHWRDAAAETARRLSAFGVGAIVSCPAGDGEATYVVTGLRSRGSLCCLAWRGFSPDRWVSRVFGKGGWYRTRDIERIAQFGGPDITCAERSAPWEKTWAELEALQAVPPGMVGHAAAAVAS